MEGMGGGMFNICGEHKTYAVYQNLGNNPGFTGYY